MWHCTCSPPPVYDLTEALTQCCSHRKRRDNNNNTDDEKHETNVSFQSPLSAALRRWGWCPIKVDRRVPQYEVSNDKDDVPLPLCFFQKTGTEIKQTIVQIMMEPEYRSRAHHGANGDDDGSFLVYRGRAAESGAAETWSTQQQQEAEPKQSWEVRRCTIPTERKNATAALRHELQAWVEALHTIAVAVTWVLGLPPNLLVQEGTCGVDSHLVTRGTRCNVDLMRVFYYDAVDYEALGSSPHTDWGSWTVVWQDDVGGLQTYCQRHKRWVDVVPSIVDDDDSYLHFVVHLSDVTSLAMGHSLSASSLRPDTKNPVVLWPSPKHRVVSPRQGEPRASIVYFAYPPPGVTLRDMEVGLAACMMAGKEEDVVVPYEDYFVLRNQSSETTYDSELSAKQVYEKIRSRRLDEVFEDKWRQVQRA